MSRVQSTSSTPRAVPAAPAAVQPAAEPAAAPEESLFGAQQLTAAPTSSLSDVQTRNLVVDTTLTATELSLGKEVPLSQNLSAVFAEGVEGVAPTADKIVVTGITLENVYSNVPSRVSVSANLFQNQAQQNSLVNDAGWLYSAASSELAAEASEHVSYAGNDGKFVQLCSLLPMESSRHNECAIYTPTSSSLNSRHLQDYGNISSKDQVRHHNVFVFFVFVFFCVLVLTPHNVSTLQLWNGIVAVTDSTYYVPAESVVCKVIEKNWDKFGFHPQQVRDYILFVLFCVRTVLTPTTFPTHRRKWSRVRSTASRNPSCSPWSTRCTPTSLRACRSPTSPRRGSSSTCSPTWRRPTAKCTTSACSSRCPTATRRRPPPSKPPHITPFGFKKMKEYCYFSSRLLPAHVKIDGLDVVQIPLRLETHHHRPLGACLHGDVPRAAVLRRQMRRVQHAQRGRAAALRRHVGAHRQAQIVLLQIVRQFLHGDALTVQLGRVEDAGAVLKALATRVAVLCVCVSEAQTMGFDKK